MSFKIKNWKLASLALLFIALFTLLGFWQLSRAEQKERLLTAFALRMQAKPLVSAKLHPQHDSRFYRATLTGNFDNEHSFLLDNRNFQGRIGYEVYTPFHAQGLSQPVLIDRGFIPLTQSRQALPKLTAISGLVTITGLLNFPPGYFALGAINESPKITWPLCVEYVNLKQLLPFLDKNYQIGFFPYLLMLDPKDKAAYAIEWEIVTMGPEKHKGYAVQWFALALTLLILFVVLNRNRAT